MLSTQSSPRVSWNFTKNGHPRVELRPHVTWIYLGSCWLCMPNYGKCGLKVPFCPIHLKCSAAPLDPSAVLGKKCMWWIGPPSKGGKLVLCRRCLGSGTGPPMTNHGTSVESTSQHIPTVSSIHIIHIIHPILFTSCSLAPMRQGMDRHQTQKRASPWLEQCGRSCAWTWSCAGAHLTSSHCIWMPWKIWKRIPSISGHHPSFGSEPPKQMTKFRFPNLSSHMVATSMAACEPHLEALKTWPVTGGNNILEPVKTSWHGRKSVKKKHSKIIYTTEIYKYMHTKSYKYMQIHIITHIWISDKITCSL